MSAHLYWSLNISAIASGTNVVVSELEMYTAIGGVSVCTGGTASATSELNSDWSAGNAFDGILDSNEAAHFWISSEPFSTPERIAYEFLTPVDIVQYKINIAVDGSGGKPLTWTYDYSDDGVNWTVVHTETDYFFTTDNALFLVPATVDAAFINHRVSATNNALINRRISATDITLPSQRTASTDITLSNSLIDAHDVTFHSRNIEITAVDIALIIPRVAITAVDVAFINVREQYTISRTDVAFINRREEDYQSIVIDVHNPETPVYGNYA